MKCMYCRNDLDKDRWKSEFNSHKHYKTNVCSCGKKSWVTVDYEGSGHEKWDGEVKFMNAPESMERLIRSERHRLWKKEVEEE